jgi:hypothetical protein
MTHPYHKTAVKMFMFIEIVMTYVTEKPGTEVKKCTIQILARKKT